MFRFSNSILRSVCFLAIGILLVVWPDAAMVYLVITIGALFLIPGLFSLVGYFVHRSDDVKQFFPISSVGSVLFGLWLMIMPTFFVGILMYVLGAILVLAGVQLIAGLLVTRRQTVVGIGYYVIPVVILLAGILVLMNPFATASIPFIILGVSCICYSVSDLLNYYKFRSFMTKLDKDSPVVDAVVIEEHPSGE